MTDVARVVEVLAGEDIGYLGGVLGGRFTGAAPTAAVATPADADKSKV